MKILKTLGFLLMILFNNSQSFAQQIIEKDALVIVRFNQEMVNYEKHLKKAIEAAHKVNPDAKYRIIYSFSHFSTDENNRIEGDKVLANVKAMLMSSHIKSENMKFFHDTSKEFSYDRLLIFVESI